MTYVLRSIIGKLKFLYISYMGIHASLVVVFVTSSKNISGAVTVSIITVIL